MRDASAACAHARQRSIAVARAHVDGCDRVPKDDNVEAKRKRVQHRVEHAVVGGQSADDNSPDAVPTQRSAQFLACKSGVLIVVDRSALRIGQPDAKRLTGWRGPLRENEERAWLDARRGSRDDVGTAERQTLCLSDAENDSIRLLGEAQLRAWSDARRQSALENDGLLVDRLDGDDNAGRRGRPRAEK